MLLLNSKNLFHEYKPQKCCLAGLSLGGAMALGAGISGGASLLGAGISSAIGSGVNAANARQAWDFKQIDQVNHVVDNQINIKEAQNNRNFQAEQAELQYQRALEMWRMEQEYNSPQAQMQRMKEAGVNPMMAFGGSLQNVSSSPSVPSAPSGSQASASGYSTQSAIPMQSNYGDTIAQSLNMLGSLFGNLPTSIVQAGKTKAETDKILADTQYQQMVNQMTPSMLAMELKEKMANVDYTRQKTNESKADEMQKNMLFRSTQMQIMQGWFAIRQMYSQETLNQAQTGAIASNGFLAVAKSYQEVTDITNRIVSTYRGQDLDFISKLTTDKIIEHISSSEGTAHSEQTPITAQSNEFGGSLSLGYGGSSIGANGKSTSSSQYSSTTGSSATSLNSEKITELKKMFAEVPEMGDMIKASVCAHYLQNAKELNLSNDAIRKANDILIEITNRTENIMMVVQQFYNNFSPMFMFNPMSQGQGQ